MYPVANGLNYSHIRRPGGYSPDTCTKIVQPLYKSDPVGQTRSLHDSPVHMPINYRLDNGSSGRSGEARSQAQNSQDLDAQLKFRAECVAVTDLRTLRLLRIHFSQLEGFLASQHPY